MRRPSETESFCRRKHLQCESSLRSRVQRKASRLGGLDAGSEREDVMKTRYLGCVLAAIGMISHLSALAPAPKTGLYGIPLPDGVKLVKKAEGSRLQIHGPYETYQVLASAQELRVFFESHLTGTGWTQVPREAEQTLFFRKGGMELTIIVSREGGMFTVMGR